MTDWYIRLDIAGANIQVGKPLRTAGLLGRAGWSAGLGQHGSRQPVSACAYVPDRALPGMIVIARDLGDLGEDEAGTKRG